MIAKIKGNKKKGLGKEIFFSLLIIIGFIVLIGVLINANARTNKKRAQYVSRINELKQEIEETENKKEELEKALAQVGSRESLEKIAREQLGMKNPGEEVVVISKEEEASSSEISLEDEEKKNFWNPKYWWEWLRGK